MQITKANNRQNKKEKWPSGICFHTGRLFFVDKIIFGAEFQFINKQIDKYITNFAYGFHIPF
jgi:hypothetical protein